MLHENVNNINKRQRFSNLCFKIQIHAAYKKYVLNIKIQKVWSKRIEEGIHWKH